MIGVVSRRARPDQSAIAAALAEPWSNGQTEGQITKGDIEADDFGSFRHKVGVVVFAPRFATREVDLLRPQEAPDVLVVHVAEPPARSTERSNWRSPRGRFRVEQRQDPPARFGSILPRGAPFCQSR